MIKDNFAVFILSHGRPDNNVTYKTLKKHGYTGKIYIILDNEDSEIEKYKRNFKDCIVFNKKEVAKRIDVCDNFDKRNSVVYARNEVFNIAKDLGLDYFLQLDDDYSRFEFSYNNKNEFCHIKINNLDRVFEIMINFLKNTNANTVAMAQVGDFIGGKNNGFLESELRKRKAMNSFMCRTDRPLKFTGRINEDVNAYVLEGMRGILYFTLPNLSLIQKQTQSNEGGLTDIYLELGTYLKSFYTIMQAPSCVKLMMMGSKHKRIHHQITWNNAVPRIIREEYKKV